MTTRAAISRAVVVTAMDTVTDQSTAGCCSRSVRAGWALRALGSKSM